MKYIQYANGDNSSSIPPSLSLQYMRNCGSFKCPLSFAANAPDGAVGETRFYRYAAKSTVHKETAV